MCVRVRVRACVRAQSLLEFFGLRLDDIQKALSSKTSFDNPCLRRYNCVFWVFTYCACERRHLFFAFHLLSLCELWQSYDILPRSSRKKYPLMLSHTSSADLVRLHTRACFSLSVGLRRHLALRTSCCHPCQQEGLLLHGWSWICLCTNAIGLRDTLSITINHVWLRIVEVAAVGLPKSHVITC